MRQPHRLAAGLATFTGTRAGPPAKRLRGLGGVRPYNFAGRVSVDLHKCSTGAAAFEKVQS